MSVVIFRKRALAVRRCMISEARNHLLIAMYTIWFLQTYCNDKLFKHACILLDQPGINGI